MFAKLHFKGLRALSRAESFSERTLHKLRATHPMFEMPNIRGHSSVT